VVISLEQGADCLHRVKLINVQQLQIFSLTDINACLAVTERF